MLNSNIINNITTLYFKNKFNNVLKQVKQVEHRFDEYYNDESHNIIIRVKNYDIEYTYDNYGSIKCISRYNDLDTYGTAFPNNYIEWFETVFRYVDNPSQSLKWGCSDDLLGVTWPYADDDDDINHIKEMERNVIEYFNTLKPVKRIIKIKK